MWNEQGCVGGYAPNSHKIPKVALIGTAATVAVFIGMAYIGAAVGF